MKKFTVIALFIMLAMIMVACAPEDTDPGVGTPGISDAGETIEPGFGVVETPLVTETVLDTPVVTPEVTPEVTLETTPDTTTATPVAGAVVDDEDNPARASNLLALLVKNAEDETLGDIENFIVNMGEEQISYAIIGVGGFLGIGERSIAVPYESLTLQQDEDNDWFFLWNVDEEALENAPEVDWNDIDLHISGWDVDFRTYWTTGALPADDDDDDDAAQTPGDTVATAMAPYAIRMTDLLGADVHVEDTEVVTVDQQTVPATPATPAQPGVAPATPATPAQPGGSVTMTRDLLDDVGDVEEVFVDPQTGQILYVVVDPDDALELGEVWVPVPLRSLEFTFVTDDDVDFDDLVIIADRERMVNAPNFEAGLYPVFTDPNWDVDFRGYWVVE